jgi:hypothetical protein
MFFVLGLDPANGSEAVAAETMAENSKVIGFRLKRFMATSACKGTVAIGGKGGTQQDRANAWFQILSLRAEVARRHPVHKHSSLAAGTFRFPCTQC